MGEVQVNFFPPTVDMLETFSRVFAASRHDRARECFPSGPVFAQALAAVACILASASLPFFLSRIGGTLAPAEYRPSSAAVAAVYGHPGARRSAKPAQDLGYGTLRRRDNGDAEIGCASVNALAFAGPLAAGVIGMAAAGT